MVFHFIIKLFEKANEIKIDLVEVFRSFVVDS